MTGKDPNLSRSVALIDLNRQGLQYFSKGAFEKALRVFERSLEVSPDQSEIVGKQIECLIQLDQILEAEEITRKELTRSPHNEIMLNYLGHILMLQDKTKEAAESFQEAVSSAGINPLSHYNLATAELKLQNWDNAEQALSKVLDFDPKNIDAIRGMGLVNSEKGNFLLARKFLLQATNLNPQHADSWYDLGNACMDLELWEDAKIAFQQSLKHKTQNPNAAINLAQVLIQLDEHENAEALTRNLIKIYPSRWRSWFNLGQYQYKVGRFKDAAKSFGKGLEIENEQWELYNALAISLHELGNFEEAESLLRKAIRLNPEAADAHWNYSLTLLSSGNFAQGWAAYEWRWKRSSFPTKPPKTTCPKWHGEEGALCLYTEQGFGDNIQFLRFIKDAKLQCKNKVVLYAESPLCRLFRSSTDIEVREKSKNWDSDLTEFSYQSPLLSLPYILKIPSEKYGITLPYIKSHKEDGLKWPNQHSRNDKEWLKVGLAWQGNQQNKPGLKRSIPEKVFFDWLDKLPDSFEYFSLQPENTGLTIETPNRRAIHTFQRKPKDFADTADFLESMDIIISVDTAIAHLTGAMSKKLYLLLYATPDWRWINGDQPDLWYSGITIYRQEFPGDWSAPLTKLQTTLLEEYR